MSKTTERKSAKPKVCANAPVEHQIKETLPAKSKVSKRGSTGILVLLGVSIICSMFASSLGIFLFLQTKSNNIKVEDKFNEVDHQIGNFATESNLTKAELESRLRDLEDQFVSAQSTINELTNLKSVVDDWKENSTHSTEKMTSDILHVMNQATNFKQDLSKANSDHTELKTEVANLKATTANLTENTRSGMLSLRSQVNTFARNLSESNSTLVALTNEIVNFKVNATAATSSIVHNLELVNEAIGTYHAGYNLISGAVYDAQSFFVTNTSYYYYQMQFL